MKVVSIIQLCLADDVIYSVMEDDSTIKLWLRLKKLYITKNLLNKLYLKQ